MEKSIRVYLLFRKKEFRQFPISLLSRITNRRYRGSRSPTRPQVDGRNVIVKYPSR